MQRMAPLAIPILLLMSACGGDARVGETSGRESAAGDVDVADRECRVILRRADFIADRTTGLAVTIDVASGLLADPGATPGLLVSADGGAWQEVAAQPATEDPAPAGFQRFVARFTLLASADFIAFARTTTAVRLFDHNRLPGDFDAFHVDAANGFTVGEAPAICPGLPPLGTLTFGAGWTQTQRGDLVDGGRLEVDYDLSRLTACRDTHDGYRFWTLDAYAQFQPGGQLVSGTLVASNGAVDMPTPFVTSIPAGATSVALWFENASPPSCAAWDSRYGANYVFAVRSSE
jgi:hypothetical protein